MRFSISQVVLVNLFERLVLQVASVILSVETRERGWKYEIFTLYDKITVWGSELIGTGNLQPVTKEKPVFRLGELVEFRFHGDGPPIRIVQGIQLVNDCWFYSVEWMPKQFAITNSQLKSLITDIYHLIKSILKIRMLALYPNSLISNFVCKLRIANWLDEVFTSADSIARVSDYDLERVKR